MAESANYANATLFWQDVSMMLELPDDRVMTKQALALTPEAALVAQSTEGGK